MIDYDVPVTTDYVWPCHVTVSVPAGPGWLEAVAAVDRWAPHRLEPTTGPADITVVAGDPMPGRVGEYAVRWDGDGVATTATVTVGDRMPAYRRGVIVHELAHVLGLEHARAGIMHPVVHRNTMTAVDRAALAGLRCEP